MYSSAQLYCSILKRILLFCTVVYSLLHRNACAQFFYINHIFIQSRRQPTSRLTKLSPFFQVTVSHRFYNSSVTSMRQVLSCGWLINHVLDWLTVAKIVSRADTIMTSIRNKPIVIFGLYRNE